MFKRIVMLALVVIFVACAAPAPSAPPTLTPPAPATATAPVVPEPDVPVTVPPPVPSPQGTMLPTGVAGQQVDATVGQPFTLGVSQTAILRDSADQFGIMFWGVRNDSRCATDVVCVWAGEAQVDFTFQEDGLMHPPILSVYTTPARDSVTVSTTATNYLVTLVNLEPKPLSTQPIPADSYRATFVVVPAPPATTTPPSQQATPPAQQPTSQSGATATLDAPFPVKFLQTVPVADADLSVTFNGLLEESRCPKNALCVQAGRALVAVRLQVGEELGMFTLSTSPPDGQQRAYFDGYVVELVDVQPFPETPDTKTPAPLYTITVIARRAEPPTEVNKNEQFVLKVGETGRIADEGVSVTLDQMAEDSRCPAEVDCAQRGKAVIAATVELPDGSRHEVQLEDTFAGASVRIPENGDYVLRLLSVAPYPRLAFAGQTIAPDRYQVAFVLHKFAEVGGTPTPAPPSACLGIDAQDAAAILGVPVDPAPVQGVTLLAQTDEPMTSFTPDGVCGFLATGEQVLEGERTPYVSAPRPAPYAVTAANLSGAQVLELVRVGQILSAHQADADDINLLILLTGLTAGDWDVATEKLPEIAATAGVGFGELTVNDLPALWFWRATPTANYAALVIPHDDEFTLFEALLPPEISEQGAQESLQAGLK